MARACRQLNSLPPLEPHSHAHNILLHVAAELGIVGLVALALTAWIALRAARRPSDSTAAMGIAAFAGFVAHQMFDVPAMMPTIALVALAALVLALPARKDTALTTMPNKWGRLCAGAGGARRCGAGRGGVVECAQL